MSAIDAYIAAAPADFRGALADIRQRIAAVLDATGEVYVERMSYAMPGFAVDGKMVAGYAAHAKHCGYYPHSGGVLPRMVEEIGTRGHTKSALHFTPDDPIPDDVLRRMIALRLAEIRRA